jgi:flagellar hook assembly protein FlgD
MLTLTKQKAIPTSFELTQNYPNPFNPTTVIKYSLPESRDVKLVIYNSLGEKVKTLVNGIQEPGYYTTIWEGTNDQGIKVGSGMYIYAIKAGKDISVKKMMLVK